jgi:hypothetical protein
VCDEITTMRNRNACSRERPLLDPLFQNAECPRELLILFGKAMGYQTVSNVVQRRPQVAFVIGL